MESDYSIRKERVTLEQKGLYCSEYEHDACGVGMVCTLSGVPTHQIVRNGLEILINMDHRGACGCDEDTGDGAGILTEIPHRFFETVLHGVEIDLPARGDYGVGMVFLPVDSGLHQFHRVLIEQVVEEEGLQLLGWREVPLHPEKIGTAARNAMPSIWQLFVGRPDTLDPQAFERKLFVVRKVVENGLKNQADDVVHDTYFASLSSKTIVYKGMLTTSQLGEFYDDLTHPAFESVLALVHSRFSTNTFPEWALAHPFRKLCHNGEINTLRGNRNWFNAREALFRSAEFGHDLEKIVPIITEKGSDSQGLDNALELLCMTGRSLPHALMMMIPEAWENNELMDEKRRAFYEYHSSLMEAWDGPATVLCTDGRYVAAALDRNGLRPSRYTLTKDGLVVLGSETGILNIDPANVAAKGRLQPGKLFLIDLEERRIVEDEEIKEQVASEQPYAYWLSENQLHLDELVPATAEAAMPPPEKELHTLRQVFGYTREDLKLLMGPMFINGKEALGSMGDDTPLAVLSERPRMLYDYFRQLFAQVTNPPLDAIREELVTSLQTLLGSEQNLFVAGAEHCRRIRLKHPVLGNEELATLLHFKGSGFAPKTIVALFSVASAGAGLKRALDKICEEAGRAVDDGATLLHITDRGVSPEKAPIPMLLATGALHHYLIKTGRRMKCSLVLESAEPREVHHFATLLGYGADAINPYLALDTLPRIKEVHLLNGLEDKKAIASYKKAVCKGILKVMSKMGISTLQSYRGAQIFEAIGIHQDVIDAYFTGTPTRIGGIPLDVIAEEALARHQRGFPAKEVDQPEDLDVGGRYQWRRNGEHHQFNPLTIARLQQATQSRDGNAYQEFANLVNEQNKQRGALRGLFDFKQDLPAVPLEEVEPWTEIVKRFKTGAMSYGSISSEAHESLAVAMNTLGGKSNTGEGGEDPLRYSRNNKKRSRIKQVASGRFGVTMAYLESADEIQIKMAQGAKPGEGGQLPGAKVYPWIASVRHSTPYVGLISPPPHHDIYSIEDLAQLIYDLKNANPLARIAVKLVSEVGVGTVAAGVAKGKADVVLISGSDGGTGASPQTSVAHTGLPWELGLAETHQTLVLNGLRSRIKIECDGQMKTGRDIAIAALLGADEFGFATVPLVAMGCIMMRKCHLNTCPVGIATQDPELREKFEGKPEHVVNYFYFVAEELRQIMASLGYRSLDEMIGQVERLKMGETQNRWKAKYLDLSRILAPVQVPASLQKFQASEQVHDVEDVIDRQLIKKAENAIKKGQQVHIELPVRNTYRTMGTQLSNAITRFHGQAGLTENTVVIDAKGSVGQSCCAFGVKGITMRIEGDANDYFGKGLSGARLIIKPPTVSDFTPEENIIIGNVALYGGTSGQAFIRGLAGERFAVRNSGVEAVVEGVGDHGCEYMTGGRVVVLGETGRNFAAGMSGGIAYVLDSYGHFERRCNLEMVDLVPVEDPDDLAELQQMIRLHTHFTGSSVGQRVLEQWEDLVSSFVKVYPTEYRKALERLKEESSAYAEPVSNVA